ncbi:sensor histidine kinase [Kutzneria kofuensis]|uniref:Two-component system sensor histidine kinase DesK n=1 Tax=Kutzneria kofuensis TaxID=103725 RepID=A0A7W9NG15_9PSEU|nr:histidine kinase [Kutzneria kofuensis]MBB5890691.1 two-component system sensor histidine kinase DesK [Kutzneria kofuensis]
MTDQIVRDNHRGWVVSASFFVLFMLPAVVAQFGVDRPVWMTATAVGGLVLYGIAYVLLPLVVWRASTSWQVAAGVVYMGTATALSTVATPYIFIWAFALCAVIVPGWWLAVVNGAAFVTLVVVLPGSYLGLLVILLSVTVLCRSVVHMIEINRELRLAREQVTALAVADERGRIARDLHDVLGHSLTTVTVKAGLARRMLEAGVVIDRALAEMRDVERLSQQALADITATVSGERTASLAAELVGAKEALRAAGITADFPLAVDDVASEYQEAFAFALREGVTNVLRHSAGATRCEVRLGDSWLEVRDDGDPEPAAANPSRVVGGGNGLSGLSERLEGIGARLEAGPLPSQGFRLRVEVPA